jgi:dynein light chain roadblock-type
MASFISQPASSSSVNQVQGHHSSNSVSPELEQTLSMLSSHRSVLGYMLVTRGHHPSIIRHSGVIFEGEQGKRYAAVVARIVESVQTGLEEIRGDDGLGAVTGDADLVCAFTRILHLANTTFQG